jgi:hypothetical protein
LQPHKELLEEKKMWPMPAGMTSAQWLEEVRNLPESSRKYYEYRESIGPDGKKRRERIEKTEALHTPDRKIELLQNEYIYLKQQKDLRNADVVKAELQKQGAKVLASLDVRDARGENSRVLPARAANPPAANDDEIVPVEEGYPLLDRVSPEFRGLGNMHRVGNLIWSGVPRQRMNQAKAAQFCREKGAFLPTRENYEVLSRAMGHPNNYHPVGSQIWRIIGFGRRRFIITTPVSTIASMALMAAFLPSPTYVEAPSAVFSLSSLGRKHHLKGLS